MSALSAGLEAHESCHQSLHLVMVCCRACCKGLLIGSRLLLCQQAWRRRGELRQRLASCRLVHQEACSARNPTNSYCRLDLPSCASAATLLRCDQPPQKAGGCHPCRAWVVSSPPIGSALHENHTRLKRIACAGQRCWRRVRKSLAPPGRSKSGLLRRRGPRRRGPPLPPHSAAATPLRAPPGRRHRRRLELEQQALAPPERHAPQHRLPPAAPARYVPRWHPPAAAA
jgi:hypothetical protein